MAKVPLAEERVVFSGVSFSQAGSTGAGGGSPLSAALSNWADERWARLREEAMQRTTDEAIRRQQDMGTEGIAEVPESVRGQYAKAFEDQAAAVFGTNLALEAQRTASSMAMEYETDPDGFAQAYNTWMVEQLDPLETVSPQVALEVRTKLDGLGIRVQSQLMENAAGQAADAERAQLFSDLQTLISESQDDLLRNPDMGALEQYEVGIAEQLAQARDAGLISATAEANERASAEANLRRQYARGRFGNALDAGDIGGARGVITMLRQGGLFDDNEEGRRLANSLAQELEAATESADAVSSEHLSIARRTLDSAERMGTNLENPQVRQALDTMMLGDDADRDRALRFTNSIAVREQFGPAINAMSTAELNAQEQRMRDNPAVFDQEILGELKAQIERRREQLNEAESSGNLLNADQDLRLFPVATDRDVQQARQQISRSRAQVARAYGVPMDEVPLVNDTMASQAQDELSEARRIGDAGRAVEVVEQMMVAAQTPHDRVSAALTAGDPALAGFAMMAAIAPDVSEDLFGLAFQGSTANQQAKDRAFDAVDGAREVVFETADRLSMGRPAVRDALEVELTNALTALANDFEARGTDLKVFGNGVLREFKSLLAPFEAEVQLDNGARVPSAMISPTEQNELNVALTDTERVAELFGDAMVGDPATLASLTPHPLPDGQWAFRSSRSGRLAVDAAGEVIKLDARPAVEAASERQLTEGSSFMGRIFKGRTPTQQALEVDIPRVADVTSGGSTEMLEAVFKAGLKVPSNEKIGREYTMMWAIENVSELDRGAYEKAWRDAATASERGFADRPGPMGRFNVEDPPDPTRDPFGAKIAAALLMDHFAERFGDGDRALAAYFIGADVIEEAGDNWRRVVPDDVFMFIDRVKEEL